MIIENKINDIIDYKIRVNKNFVPRSANKMLPPFFYSALFIESSYSALFNCHESSPYKSYIVRESRMSPYTKNRTHLETCRITFIDTTFANLLRKLALDNP